MTKVEWSKDYNYGGDFDKNNSTLFDSTARPFTFLSGKGNASLGIVQNYNTTTSNNYLFGVQEDGGDESQLVNYQVSLKMEDFCAGFFRLNRDLYIARDQIIITIYHNHKWWGKTTANANISLRIPNAPITWSISKPKLRVAYQNVPEVNLALKNNLKRGLGQEIDIEYLFSITSIQKLGTDTHSYGIRPFLKPGNKLSHLYIIPTNPNYNTNNTHHTYQAEDNLINSIKFSINSDVVQEINLLDGEHIYNTG